MYFCFSSGCHSRRHGGQWTLDSSCAQAPKRKTLQHLCSQCFLSRSTIQTSDPTDRILCLSLFFVFHCLDQWLPCSDCSQVVFVSKFQPTSINQINIPSLYPCNMLTHHTAQETKLVKLCQFLNISYIKVPSHSSNAIMRTCYVAERYETIYMHVQPGQGSQWVKPLKHKGTRNNLPSSSSFSEATKRPQFVCGARGPSCSAASNQVAEFIVDSQISRARCSVGGHLHCSTGPIP